MGEHPVFRAPREAFDLPRDIAYFDTAAKGLLAQPCATAYREATAILTRPWEKPNLSASAAAERIRADAGAFYGARPDDVALLRSVSAGIALALESVTISANDAVLRLAGDHPSIGLQTARAAARSGAREIIVADDGGDWTTATLAAIADAGPIAALVLTPAFWTDGRPIDLRAVVQSARNLANTALIIDATHAAGIMADDFSDIVPDFIVFPAFKWLLGPTGIAFMVVLPDRQSGEPADRNAYNSLTDSSAGFAGFNVGARRYDMGERDAPGQMLPAAAALEFIASQDRAALHEKLVRMAGRIAEHARGLGMAVTGGSVTAPHILGIAVPGHDPAEVTAWLRTRGIVVSARGAGIRVSLYLHNDEEDVDRFLKALDELAGAPLSAN